jgi:hypothetical protein
MTVLNKAQVGPIGDLMPRHILKISQQGSIVSLHLEECPDQGLARGSHFHSDSTLTVSPEYAECLWIQQEFLICDGMTAAL